MPMTPKGRKILRSMGRTYGSEEGKKIFYASINKGTILDAERTEKGIDSKKVDSVNSDRPVTPFMKRKRKMSNWGGRGYQ